MAAVAAAAALTAARLGATPLEAADAVAAAVHNCWRWQGSGHTAAPAAPAAPPPTAGPAPAWLSKGLSRLHHDAAAVVGEETLEPVVEAKDDPKDSAPLAAPGSWGGWSRSSQGNWRPAAPAAAPCSCDGAGDDNDDDTEVADKELSGSGTGAAAEAKVIPKATPKDSATPAGKAGTKKKKNKKGGKSPEAAAGGKALKTGHVAGVPVSERGIPGGSTMSYVAPDDVQEASNNDPATDDEPEVDKAEMLVAAITWLRDSMESGLMSEDTVQALCEQGEDKMIELYLTVKGDEFCYA